MPRRIINRLNQISRQLDAMGVAGEAAADERYELTYRDYLLQRFYRVEAGTVRMTTNLEVDLQELFVMPRVLARPLPGKGNGGGPSEVEDFMDLAAARAFFGERTASPGEDVERDEDKGKVALEQVRSCPRNVFVGVPGSGKSTFLEWLQVMLASVDEELVMAGEQAIPVLIHRLR